MKLVRKKDIGQQKILKKSLAQRIGFTLAATPSPQSRTQKTSRFQPMLDSAVHIQCTYIYFIVFLRYH